MKIANFIAEIIEKIEQSLVRSSHEPQIKQKSDRHGHKYWQVYDLYTDKSYTFSSEQDVRVWIENRSHSF